jgi:hypothetical protein
MAHDLNLSGLDEWITGGYGESRDDTRLCRGRGCNALVYVNEEPYCWECQDITIDPDEPDEEPWPLLTRVYLTELGERLADQVLAGRMATTA